MRPCLSGCVRAIAQPLRSCFCATTRRSIGCCTGLLATPRRPRIWRRKRSRRSTDSRHGWMVPARSAGGSTASPSTVPTTRYAVNSACSAGSDGRSRSSRAIRRTSMYGARSASACGRPSRGCRSVQPSCSYCGTLGYPMPRSRRRYEVAPGSVGTLLARAERAFEAAYTQLHPAELNAADTAEETTRNE